MAETPIGEIFYTKISPDGVHGETEASQIVRRTVAWGLRTIEVEGTTFDYTLIHATNWFGRLRLWLGRRL